MGVKRIIIYTVKHTERGPNVKVYADRKRGYTFHSRTINRFITPNKPTPEPSTLAELTQTLIEVCNNFKVDYPAPEKTEFTIYMKQLHKTGPFKSSLVGLVKVRFGLREEFEWRQLVLAGVGPLRGVRDEYFREIRGIEYPETPLMPNAEFNVFRAEVHREAYPTFVPTMQSLYDKEPQNVAREESQLYPTIEESHYGFASEFDEAEEHLEARGIYEGKFK